jgi:lysophospholipase L1-like esterase
LIFIKNQILSYQDKRIRRVMRLQILLWLSVLMLWSLGQTETSKETFIDFNWPNTWVVFGPLPQTANVEEFLSLRNAPSSLEIAGKTYKPRSVEATQGKIDFGRLFKDNGDISEINENDQVLIFGMFTAPQSGKFYAGSGGDWWMRWSLDGQEILSTLEHGNQTGTFNYTNHSMRAEVQKGEHLLSALIKSGSGGWKVFGGGGNEAARTALEKAEQEALVRLKLEQEREARILKNSRMKVAIFGSSVAKGYGADKEYGWANRWGEILKTKNWDYVNKSIGGDNTSKLLSRIDIDILSEHPDVVVIGLSLANEGIRGKNPLSVYRGYVKNLKKIIQILHKNNIVPIISNGYPHGAYTPEQYQFAQKFNEELALWPVYSIDLMGAMDDGQGRWLMEFTKDAGHPNSAGHEEMTRAIPATMLDSVWNVDLPSIVPAKSWTSLVTAQGQAHFQCQADRELHSSTFGFEVQLPDNAQGDVLLAKSEVWTCELNIQGAKRSIELVHQGQHLALDIPNSKELRIAISTSYGREELSLWLNGKATKMKFTRSPLQNFHVYGNVTEKTNLKFRNVFLYYSALSDNILNKMFSTARVPMSSLALYAPCDDSILAAGIPLINLAPSEISLLAE